MFFYIIGTIFSHYFKKQLLIFKIDFLKEKNILENSSIKISTCRYCFLTNFFWKYINFLFDGVKTDNMKYLKLSKILMKAKLIAPVISKIDTARRQLYYRTCIFYNIVFLLHFQICAENGDKVFFVRFYCAFNFLEKLLETFLLSWCIKI